jgi:hypothetical protein
MNNLTTTLRNVLGASALLTLLAACATTGSTTASPQKDTILAQAGFKTKTVTTAKQQQQVKALPAGKVSAVNLKGKTYFVYPDTAHNQIYVGNKAQYQAYKKARQAQVKQAQMQQANQQNNPAPTWVNEIEGPEGGVKVEEFEGFGPLGGEWQAQQ